MWVKVEKEFDTIERWSFHSVSRDCDYFVSDTVEIATCPFCLETYVVGNDWTRCFHYDGEDDSYVYFVYLEEEDEE